MRIVIVGAGLVGLTLARMLRQRGLEPLVLERGAPAPPAPRPFMLGSQAFPALEDAGALAEVRERGWDIAPRPGTDPAAVCVEFAIAVEVLGRGVPVNHERTVTALQRDGAGRVVGVVAERPDGSAEQVPADLVVACDGVGSPVRGMAGLEAELTPTGEGQITFLSPAVADRSFAMGYLRSGGMVGMLGWPQGSGGWRTVERVGREAALAPGVRAFAESFARLLPEAAEAVGALTSLDQLRYGEPTLLRCPRWWVPGVVIIGDSAHFFGPETGIGAALGLGDAHALSIAIERNPDDPDASCTDYERWRGPAVRPYEANDPARHQVIPAPHERPPEERWPPG